MCAHDLNALFKACGKKDVTVHEAPENDARRDFGLKDRWEILNALSWKQLQDWKWIPPSETYRNDPRFTVDAYNFSYKGIKGYMAFFRVGDTNRYVIKSFKRDDPSYKSVTFDPKTVTKTLKEIGFKGKFLSGGQA